MTTTEQSTLTSRKAPRATTTMRAARLHAVGTPFEVDEVPVPDVTGSDVLVRVHACGVVPNLKNITHHFAAFLPLPELPAIYGLDPAGVIAAVGPDVTSLKVGQRVYVNPSRTCGSCAKCRAGKLTDCPSYTFAGYFGFGPGSREVFKRYPYGGYAEYTLAPANAIVPLPDEVSFEDGAHFGYLGTSYAALRRAHAGPDTVLLINGATGTLGVGAILLALAMGVPKILAVGRNHERLERLKALAPRRILTHSVEDGSTAEWAKQNTDGVGVDVVIDALAPGTPTSVLLDGLYSVARGGTIVTIGGVLEPIEFSAGWLMTSGITYLGSVWFTTEQGEEMGRMVAAGTLDLSSYEHQRFSLDDVNEAVAASLVREHGGFTNVVVQI